MPTILLLSICPKDMNACIHKKNYLRIFIAALSVIAPNWEEKSINWRMTNKL